MALIQLGGGITGIRNSLKGNTFSQNKGGAYMKGKPIPTNPKSTRQRAVRAAFALNAKRWSGVLSDSDRAAWNFFAAANPYTNIFGEVKQLSGMAMMMKLSQVLSNIGVAFVPSPPPDLSVAALAAAIDVTGTVVAGVLNSLAVDTDAQAVVAHAHYYVFATPPLPQGKVAGVSDYRFLTDLAAVAAATTLAIYVPWQLVFGTAAAAGTHISVIVATVNTQTGATSPGFKFDTGVL